MEGRTEKRKKRGEYFAGERREGEKKEKECEEENRIDDREGEEDREE